MIDLDKDVKYIKGVGPTRVLLLNKLGIFTLKDLITYYPRTYEDRNGAKVKAFEVEVETVEFFTPRTETQPEVTRATRERVPQQMGMDRLSEIEDNQLPF